MVLFDKTITMQRERTNRYTCFLRENTHKIVTKYLISFFLKKVTSADFVQKIVAYQKKSKLPFEHLFNIFCDGPNINKAVWSRLNGVLKEMGHQGLISFCSCSIHTLYNAFKKCIEALEGGRASELAYDLHIWFKK